nr:unnamed protein product [Callosobruchus analis]
MCESADDEHKKILEEKAKRRQLLREYFQKEKSNPFRHALSEGGTVVSKLLSKLHNFGVAEHFGILEVSRRGGGCGGY